MAILFKFSINMLSILLIANIFADKICISSSFAREVVGKNSKLEGLGYDKARSIILSYGWIPRKGPCDTLGKDTCRRYPEIDDCSVSLPVQCAMVFSRENRCLIISTVGESPPGFEEGEPVITRVRFTSSPCPGELR